MAQGGNDQWLAKQISKATADYDAEQERDARAARRQRVWRSVRQFLLFLVFVGVAAGYFFRDRLEPILGFRIGGAPEEPAAPRVGAEGRAHAAIQAVSREADKRNGIVQELER